MTLVPESRSKAISVCFAALVLLTCFNRASAATLADYRRRVSEAIGAIQQLQLQLAQGYEDPLQRESSVKAKISHLRDQLPAEETVLLRGQSVAVDNSWLHEALNDYEKIRNDNARSAELLKGIGERLLALAERLDEMQKGVSSGNKDENKGRLAEILRRPEYNKNVEEGSALDRLWARFLRWLGSLLPKGKPIQPGSSRTLSGVAQVIVIAVCIAGIALLIWKFAPRYLRNRGKKKKKREARIVLGERLEPDQTSADLLAQAEALARSGDLRAAIRKAYIALLCELGDRKVVSLAQHKTNRDYLNSVRERVSLHSSMRRLTDTFELHWYGFQPAGEGDWKEFRTRYYQALNTP